MMEHTWSPGGNMSIARRALAGAGTQTAGLGFAGYGPSVVHNVATEEYNGSTWTGGGNLGTARYGLGGAGTQTAALAFGGYDTTFLVDTEEYDGSTWTAGGNLNTARFETTGAGLQTAALAFGGAPHQLQEQELQKNIMEHLGQQLLL
jgi:hypothetical protein